MRAAFSFSTFVGTCNLLCSFKWLYDMTPWEQFHIQNLYIHKWQQNPIT